MAGLNIDLYLGILMGVISILALLIKK